MSHSYINGSGGGLENGTNSPIFPAQGAVSVRNNALSTKLTSVLSRSYADPEIRDTLSILDARGLVNDANTRRTLRLDAQKEVIECNGAIVQDFGVVAQQLERIGIMITNLNRACDEMRKEIHNAQRESAPMLEEAASLTAQKEAVDAKKQLLDAFNEHFIVSDEELTLLTNSSVPVDDRFFQIMNRVKQIRKDCEVLLGSEDQNLGLELMEQTSRNLNAAFQKLYSWIQREFKSLDLEDPHISGTIRRALRVLAERPTLFQNCLDFFADAREHALSEAFHIALTESVAGGSMANPIELQTHDLLRYVGDMLAWVHSTTVSEREALEGLFISDGNEIAKEIQAGRDNEPWSHMQDDEKEPENTTSVFDGRKALNDLVNRDLESVARQFKQRVEMAVQSNDDPLLVYRALNLFRFYRDIFSKLFGAPSTLGDAIADLQKSAFSHFERLLHDETSNLANETLPEDLSTPSFLLHALDRFKSFTTASPDLSEADLSQLLSTALIPFLDHCSEMSSTISDPASHSMFQLNYLSTTHNTLQPILPPNHGFLAAASKKIAEQREEIIETQHSFLLLESGVETLLSAIREADTSSSFPSASIDLSSTTAFKPDALSTSAARLDDFLPSAWMDMLENMKGLMDKRMAKGIAAEVVERFCRDFEVVEEGVLRADEQRLDGGEEGEDKVGKGEGDAEEEEGVLLRDVYPRTTAEIRVLLS